LYDVRADASEAHDRKSQGLETSLSVEAQQWDLSFHSARGGMDSFSTGYHLSQATTDHTCAFDHPGIHLAFVQHEPFTV
jgi:hypothetical protein